MWQFSYLVVLVMMMVVVIGGRGCGLVRLADRRREGRLGRRRHRGSRGLMQNLLLRGQQELLHQGRRRVVRVRVGIVCCRRGGDEDAAAVAGALVVNDGFAAH